jgi:oxygen-dependent protoporphyrinogen oxidase
VTGLSAAYFLRSKFPHAKITIYEASKRLGGWVDSETVEVDGGKVLFEWGPRSLRPDLSGPGKITAQLVGSLDCV